MRMTIRNSIGGSRNLENEVKKILEASISSDRPSKPVILTEKLGLSDCREMSSPKSIITRCSSKELSPTLPEPSHNEAEEIDDHMKDPSLEAYQRASGLSQHEAEEEDPDVSMDIDEESSQKKPIGVFLLTRPECDDPGCDDHNFFNTRLSGDSTQAVLAFNCNEAEQTIVEENNQKTRLRINVNGFVQIRYEPVVLLHSSRDVPINHGLEEIKINEPENIKTQENHDEMNKDLLQTSSQSTLEANSPHNQSDIQNNSYNEVVSSFLSYFGLKEENIRQTVVRRFKFCMKKISQDFKRYKNLSSAKYLKLIYRIMKLYHIDSNSQNRDFAENVVFDIRYLIDQLGPDAFDVVYGKEKTCNNKYIKDIFSNSIMRDLYRLHHSLASQGRIYFEKFKQFNYRNLTRGDKERILFFCEKFLAFYT